MQSKALTNFLSDKQVEIRSKRAIDSKNFALCLLLQFKATYVFLAFVSIVERVQAQQDLKIWALIMFTPTSSSLSSMQKIQA